MSSSPTFDAIAPVYATDARADTFLTLASQRVNASELEPIRTQMVCYLAASMLWNSPADASAAQGVSAGPITQRATGRESIGFGMINVGAATVGDASLLNNIYGQQYIALRDSRAARAPFVARPIDLFPPIGCGRGSVT